MKKLFVIAFSFLTSIFSLRAQYYYYDGKYFDSPVLFESGFSAGIMNCLTDLGGRKGTGKNFTRDINWQNSKPVFGVYAMMTCKYWLGLRLEACSGTVQAADSLLEPFGFTTFGRYERNLSFKSRITEVQLAFEIHPLFLRNHDKILPPFLSPYMIAGIGFFDFDPKAQIKGRWYSLQPLHTEGQGNSGHSDPYKRKQFNFPIGFGLRYELCALLNARLEIIHRVLLTDYLDDVSTVYIDPVLFYNLPPGQAAIARQLFDRSRQLTTSRPMPTGSQRGDPRHNDSYFSIQLKLGIAFRKAGR
jgi:hypothetical protein